MSQPNVVQLPVDIISRFMRMTEADNTPDLYRKWAAISLVAGALERRVWTNVGYAAGKVRRSYPNLYIFLVGAPGVGKYIVSAVRELWSSTLRSGTSTPAFHTAHSNMTKASMIDSLSDAFQSFLPKNGPPEEYHSLLIAAEEFGVFLPSNDHSFISVLNDIWNAGPDYSERRRYGSAKDIKLVNPIINILGGLQPVWMSHTFPVQAWGMGLFSRVIMVYAGVGEPADPFAEGRDLSTERKFLMQSLSKLSGLYGGLDWSPEAQKLARDWAKAGCPPVPGHSRLETYCNRRFQHFVKLAIVSSVSRFNDVKVIEKVDVDRAIEWLLEAEKFMPDIFRAMTGDSDHEIVEELYRYVLELYKMSKGKPISERYLYTFLVRRVPSEKISRILEAAERANMIVRQGGSDTYIPKDRKEFVE